MKTKRFFNAFSRVLTVAFAAMCLILMASCDQAGMTSKSESTPAPAPEPQPEPTADVFDYVYNPQGEGESVINDDSTLVNKVKYASPGWAKMTVVNDTLKYFSEDVDMSVTGLKNMVAKANAEAAAMAKSRSTNGADSLTSASRSFSIFGTRQGVTIESQKMRRVIDGKPAAYLIDDAIELVEIRDVTPAKTRAEEWILSSENIIEVVGKVVSHEAGLSERTARTGLTQYLTKRFLVQKYEKNDFVSHKEIDSDRKATSSTDEFGKKTYRFFRKDKSYEDFEYVVPMNYSISPRKYDPMTVKSFDGWAFNYANNIIWAGNEAKVKESDTYKIYQREGTGLAHYNSYESFDVYYDATSQRCEYNDGTVSFSFGYEDISLSGRNHNVSPQATSERAGYDEAIFNENLVATYLGYNQSVKSSRVLFKEKAREPEPVPTDSISSEGWDGKSASKKHEADNSKFFIKWVEKHTLEDDVIDEYKFNSARVLKNKSEWKVYASENKQNTEACSVDIKEKKDSLRDGKATWYFTRLTITAKAKTTLTGSEKEFVENEILAEEVNDVYIVRNGKRYDFGKDNVADSHDGGKLGDEQTAKNGDSSYDYTLTWKHTFGNADAKSVTSPGQILVKAPEDEIIEEDWYTVSASKKHGTAQSTFKIQWRIRHSLKDDEFIDYELVRDRALKNKSEWKVYVSEKKQTTEACSVETKETDGTKKDGKATWAFKKLTVTATAKTYFTGSDTEYKINKIEAEETNEVTITRDGKVYSFGKDNINASHNNGKLGSEYSVTEGKAYDYTLTWKYFFGNAETKSVESPGTLIIKATEPEEKEPEPTPTPTPTNTPNITSVVQTTAPAKGRTDWMTVIVVSYEDGYKVPILCPSDGSKPTFGENYKEKTNIDYNSAVWNGSTYILVTAQDDGNYMSFNRDGKRKDAITYDKAKSLNWNNGNLKDNHYSVETKRFTISYSGTKITLKDTYNNKTWEF